jgi:hypothetical protein
MATRAREMQRSKSVDLMLSHARWTFYRAVVKIWLLFAYWNI